MKSKIYLLIVVVLFTQAVNAQFAAGVKAGANLTKIDGKSFKEEFRTGYLVGGFAMIGLGEKWALQPELLWNQSASRVDTNFKTVYQTAFEDVKSGKVKLNYLSIPILVNYKLIGSFLSLQAGPQFGILMNKDKNLLENGTQAFKSGDFSMLGGAQIKISKFVGSVRYVVGLNNLNDIDNNDKWKSQGFQAAVGIAF
jgi:hypothetical protein